LKNISLRIAERETKIKIQQPLKELELVHGDTFQVSTPVTPSPVKKLISFVADQIDIGHGPIGCWVGIIVLVGFQLRA
jgi:hypothetical protein